jgi:hypothetical protein
MFVAQPVIAADKASIMAPVRMWEVTRLMFRKLCFMA